MNLSQNKEETSTLRIHFPAIRGNRLWRKSTREVLFVQYRPAFYEHLEYPNLHRPGGVFDVHAPVVREADLRLHGGVLFPVHSQKTRGQLPYLLRLGPVGPPVQDWAWQVATRACARPLYHGRGSDADLPLLRPFQGLPRCYNKVLSSIWKRHREMFVIETVYSF